MHLTTKFFLMLFFTLYLCIIIFAAPIVQWQNASMVRMKRTFDSIWGHHFTSTRAIRLPLIALIFLFINRCMDNVFIYILFERYKYKFIILDRLPKTGPYFIIGNSIGSSKGS